MPSEHTGTPPLGGKVCLPGQVLQTSLLGLNKTSTADAVSPLRLVFCLETANVQQLSCHRGLGSQVSETTPLVVSRAMRHPMSYKGS